jgi:uncharacterized protein YbjT (DUF2867 family)
MPATVHLKRAERQHPLPVRQALASAYDAGMTTLVTGATGNIGRMVVDHLLAACATNVRALTVDPVRAALPPGVDVVRGYLRRPETLRAALEGVDRMYLAPTPETVDAVLAKVVEAGVRHVVDLSGEHESWWGRVARAVEASGIAWTHLWPGDFMENAFAWAPQIRATGTVCEPYPDGASAPIAMDDVAAVAAAVLTADTHVGRALSLTGPEVLTRVELVRQLGEALGREVTFVEASRDETVAALASAMGENAAWYVDTVLVGLAQYTPTATSTVEDVTGRPATTFARWAARSAERFG